MTLFNLHSLVSSRDLYLFYILPVIFDNINGFLQVQLGIYTPISILLRSFIMLVLLYSLGRKFIFKFILLLITLVPVFIYWEGIHYSNISNEIDTFIDIIYLYLFVCYYYFNINRMDMKHLFKFISIYGFLMAIIIIGCYILDVGNYSYGEEYGFGTKGYFKAGNDLSLTLVFSLVFSILYYLNYSNTIYNLLCSFCIGFGLVLIGSRVGIMLSVFIIGSFIYYVLFFMRRMKQLIVVRFLILFIVFTIIPHIFYLIYNSFDSYALNRFTLESMENARTALTNIAWSHIETFNGLSLFVGKGSDSLFGAIADGLGLGFGKNRAVEADIYEIIGSYGYFFGTSILIFFYYICWISFKLWLKNKNINSFAFMFLAFIFVIVGALAGHAIRNVMLAPVYSVLISLVLFSHKHKGQNLHLEKNTELVK